MKLTQREIELQIIKNLTSIDNAVFIASERGLKKEHFLTIEPGSTKSYTAKLFDFCLQYADKSGGNRLTETVLESYITKEGYNQAVQNKFMNLWYEISNLPSDPDSFIHLISLIKDKYCKKLLSDFMENNAGNISNENMKVVIDNLSECVNKMYSEQEEFEKDKVTLDMREAGEYFNQEYEKRINNPDIFRGIDSGLSNLDEQTFGWLPAQLIVLLAPSSGGKSVQLLNFAVHAHMFANKKVLYFSFEMSLWLCILRHLSLTSNTVYSEFKGLTLSHDDKKRLEEEFEKLQKNAYFQYLVSTDDPTPEYVEQTIREFIASKGKPDLIIVDYIGNMTTRSTPKSSKHWERNGDAAEGLFKLAKRYSVPILTAQQINRDAIKENRRNKESGKAAAYYQDAASGDQRLMHLAYYVIGLEPDKDENLCWYYPVKMRDAWFTPFAAKVLPEYNKIVPLTDTQQMALQTLKTAEASDVRTKDFNIEKKSFKSEAVELTDWDDLNV